VTGGVLAVPVIPVEFVPLLFSMNVIVQLLAYALGVYDLLIAGRSVFAHDDLSRDGAITVGVTAVGYVCLSVLIVIGGAVGRGITAELSLGVLFLLGVSSLGSGTRNQGFTAVGSAGYLGRERAVLLDAEESHFGTGVVWVCGSSTGECHGLAVSLASGDATRAELSSR
jgi:hypothetical protein